MVLVIVISVLLVLVWGALRVVVLKRLSVEGTWSALIPIGYEYKLYSEAFCKGEKVSMRNFTAVFFSVGFLVMWGVFSVDWVALLMFGGYVVTVGRCYAKLLERVSGKEIPEEIQMLCVLAGAFEVLAWLMIIGNKKWKVVDG